MRESMLVLHFIGLAMGLGTSFGFLFLGMASGKMPQEERVKFLLNILALSRMGHIGLGLSIITGLYLATPYWSTLSDNPYLMIKLGLVLLLAALIGVITSWAKKAQQGEAGVYLKKIAGMGRFTMLVGLLIVVFAVLSFH